MSIVETLTEFWTILFGQQLEVFTDHKNLTFSNFNTEHIMQWRMVLEEYQPKLMYLEGKKNIVADALSRLDLLPDEEVEESHILELLGFSDVDDLPQSACPICYKTIAKYQSKDKDLLKLTVNSLSYTLKVVHGGGQRYELVAQNDKIVIPKAL